MCTDINDRIAAMSRTIFTWCARRTPDRVSAEDLAQDILCELIRSADSLRDERAFYGFMWGVARNVYRQWLRKRPPDCVPLPDEVASDAAEGEAEEVALLRRELMLLSGRYRRAVVMYYLDDLSCAEIARRLEVSQSMVKYLLFKARHILREGMDMERNYGRQSYAPGQLDLLFWGGPTMEYEHLCDGKIAQNILLACYNDALTESEIALELGVALPYIEDDLRALHEHDLLTRRAERYSTNIIIFTDEFSRDVNVKTAALRGEIAALARDTVTRLDPRAAELFKCSVTPGENTLRWQLTCMLLYRAIVDKLSARVKLEYPLTRSGGRMFIWGAEVREHANSGDDVELGIWGAEVGRSTNWGGDFAFGISNLSNDASGDAMQFMDFPINGEMAHHYFFKRTACLSLMFAIARGAQPAGEGERALAAEMVGRGYLVRDADGRLHVNMPVMNTAQRDELMRLLDPAAEEIALRAEALMCTVERILIDHTPLKLRAKTGGMAYLRLFDDAISAPVAQLYEEGFLRAMRPGDVLPTTYTVLRGAGE